MPKGLLIVAFGWLTAMFSAENRVDRRYLDNLLATNIKLSQRVAALNFDDIRKGTGSKFEPVLPAGELKLDHRKIRRLARIDYHDSMITRALIGRLVDFVVGNGLRLETAPRQSILGIDPDSLDEWSRDVEWSFDKWSDSKLSYIEESQTFYQLQRLCFLSQIRCGEYFVRIFYFPDRIALGILDPDLVVPGVDQFKKPHNGIIYDANGREAYYNYRTTVKGETKEVLIPARLDNGMPLVLHGYMPSYANLKRGISHVAHCLTESKLLTDYELAELQSAISQSQYAFYVEPAEDVPSTGGGLDIPARGIGAISSQSTLAPDPNLENVDDEIPEYREIGTVSNRTGGIGVLGLGAGEKMKPFQRSAPHFSYPSFVESIGKFLGASIGVPYSVLQMVFGNNFSASRGEVRMFWNTVNIWRSELTSDLLRPIYEIRMKQQIALGKISAPGFSDPTLREAWLDASWYGPPMPSLDDRHQVQAVEGAAKMGLTSLKREARNYNGSDFENNKAQLRREFSNLPLTPWSQTNGL